MNHRLSTQGRILYAEDNTFDLELALAAFAQSSLVNHLDVVRDGQEAVDYFFDRLENNNLPIVAILDINMPKMSGLDVLRKLKSHEKLRAVPVVMLTSSQMESDICKSYEYGVNAFVVKPIDFEDFTKVVKSIGDFWGSFNKIPYAL